MNVNLFIVRNREFINRLAACGSSHVVNVETLIRQAYREGHQECREKIIQVLDRLKFDNETTASPEKE